MSKIIEEQLKRVLEADLSNYDEQTKTYYIPKKNTLKVAVDSCYLLHLKPQAFTNSVVNTNWNGGIKPLYPYLKVEVTSKMSAMIKVVGVGATSLESLNQQGAFWSGWLDLSDLDVLQQF